MSRVAGTGIALLLAVSGCTNRSARTSDPGASGGEPRQPPHRVFGHVEFLAQFQIQDRDQVLPEVEIPRGRAPVRYLRVCLYQKRGQHDFVWHGMAQNDVPLACTQTDEHGNYEFQIDANCPKFGSCDKSVYLVTDLCVLYRGKPQVCAVANTAQGKRVAQTPWTQDADFRKLLWSETYHLTPAHRTSTTIAWNLSCPDERGEGHERIECTKPERLGRWGRRNSNQGWNVEGVHAVEAGAQVVHKLGSLIPTASNTLNRPGFHCGGPRDQRKKNATECGDAIRLVLPNLHRLSFDGERVCPRGRKAESFIKDKRTICLANPRSAFVIAHEIGHAIHLRWMNYRGRINAGPGGWSAGTDQKTMTGEGWADFVSAVVWYARDADVPTFNTRPIEPADDPKLARTCSAGAASGEGRPAQFFWDLYDPPRETEPGDDISLDFWTLARVWSLFAGGNGSDVRNRTKGECAPHGRNLRDYLYYYDRFPERDLPDARRLLQQNCLQGQIDGVSCSNGK